MAYGRKAAKENDEGGMKKNGGVSYNGEASHSRQRMLGMAASKAWVVDTIVSSGERMAYRVKRARIARGITLIAQRHEQTNASRAAPLPSARIAFPSHDNPHLAHNTLAAPRACLRRALPNLARSMINIVTSGTSRNAALHVDLSYEHHRTRYLARAIA